MLHSTLQMAWTRQDTHSHLTPCLQKLAASNVIDVTARAAPADVGDISLSHENERLRRHLQAVEAAAASTVGEVEELRDDLERARAAARSSEAKVSLLSIREPTWAAYQVGVGLR